MRPGQGKRSRGRNGGGGGGGGGGGNPHHGNNPNRPRMPNRIQTFDSNGPAVKIRGNAYQVFERYVAMAREAASSGDRISAENLYQHAEHYFRMMNEQGAGGYNQGQQRPMTPADTEMGPGEGEQPGAENGQMAPPVQVQHQQPQQQPPMPEDDQPPSY